MTRPLPVEAIKADLRAHPSANYRQRAVRLGVTEDVISRSIRIARREIAVEGRPVRLRCRVCTICLNADGRAETPCFIRGCPSYEPPVSVYEQSLIGCSADFA